MQVCTQKFSRGVNYINFTTLHEIPVKKTLLTCMGLSVVKFINSSNELAVAYHIYKCNDVDPVVIYFPPNLVIGNGGW